MADINETPTWMDTISQVENGEPGNGGETGVANRALKQLACRTAYLKECCDNSAMGGTAVVDCSSNCDNGFISDKANMLATTSITDPQVTVYDTDLDTYNVIQGINAGSRALTLDFSNGGRYLAVGIDISPYLILYKFNTGDNTFHRLSDPSTTPSSAVYDVSFVCSGIDTFLFVREAANDSYPSNPMPDGYNLTVYRLVDDVLIKFDNYTDIAPTGTVTVCTVSKNAQYLAIISTVASIYYFTMYKLTGGVYKKFEPLSVSPSGVPIVCTMSPDSNWMFIHSMTPDNKYHPYIYKREGDAFNKINGFDLPNGDDGWYAFEDNAFSPLGNYLVLNSRNHVTSQGSYIYLFRRNGDTFLNIDPTFIPPYNDPCSMAFSKDEKHFVIAFSYDNTPSNRLAFYNVYGDTFTPISDPSQMPTDGIREIKYWV